MTLFTFSSPIPLLPAGTDYHYVDQCNWFSYSDNHLNLQNQVKFIGRIGKSEIDSYTQNAICNVIPSRREPFGIVVLEAIASGRSVLATDVGGIPEILKKEFESLKNIEEIRSLLLNYQDFH